MSPLVAHDWLLLLFHLMVAEEISSEKWPVRRISFWISSKSVAARPTSAKSSLIVTDRQLAAPATSTSFDGSIHHSKPHQHLTRNSFHQSEVQQASSGIEVNSSVSAY